MVCLNAEIVRRNVVIFEQLVLDPGVIMSGHRDEAVAAALERI